MPGKYLVVSVQDAEVKNLNPDKKTIAGYKTDISPENVFDTFPDNTETLLLIPEADLPYAKALAMYRVNAVDTRLFFISEVSYDGDVATLPQAKYKTFNPEFLPRRPKTELIAYKAPASGVTFVSAFLADPKFKAIDLGNVNALQVLPVAVKLSWRERLKQISLRDALLKIFNVSGIAYLLARLGLIAKLGALPKLIGFSALSATGAAPVVLSVATSAVIYFGGKKLATMAYAYGLELHQKIQDRRAKRLAEQAQAAETKGQELSKEILGAIAKLNKDLKEALKPLTDVYDEALEAAANDPVAKAALLAKEKGHLELVYTAKPEARKDLLVRLTAEAQKLRKQPQLEAPSAKPDSPRAPNRVKAVP